MEESLQGPINPALFENGYFGGECLEQENSNALGYCTGSSYRMFGNNKYRFSFEEEEEEEEEGDMRIPGFDNNMSFLQMLQSTVGAGNSKTQNLNPTQNFFLHPPQMATPLWAADVLDTQSPQISEITTGQAQHPYWVSGVNSDFNYQQKNSPEKSTSPTVQTKCPASNPRKRRKRNQTKPPKDKEEVESQRMTHIAVERNRRRQMNDYLSGLRSLMPPSYVQRGDQASIIGGAINFVKELEQILESLQDRKRMRKLSSEEVGSGSSSTSTMSANTNTNGDETNNIHTEEKEDEEEEERGRVKVKVTVVQKHVNLKITIASNINGEKRGSGEVVRAIVEFQRLRLTILHLNITSLQSSVHYSFSLKIEDDCNLETADEIAGAVHQIFSFINAG